jgi:hypothetical protein
MTSATIRPADLTCTARPTSWRETDTKLRKLAKPVRKPPDNALAIDCMLGAEATKANVHEEHNPNV